MIDDDERGAVGGMRMAGETEVPGENLPHCHFLQQKSHMTTWARSLATAVGSRRLTARTVAQPVPIGLLNRTPVYT
jgi:hypothetical protein